MSKTLRATDKQRATEKKIHIWNIEGVSVPAKTYVEAMKYFKQHCRNLNA